MSWKEIKDSFDQKETLKLLQYMETIETIMNQPPTGTNTYMAHKFVEFMNQNYSKPITNKNVQENDLVWKKIKKD